MFLAVAGGGIAFTIKRKKNYVTAASFYMPRFHAFRVAPAFVNDRIVVEYSPSLFPSLHPHVDLCALH